MNTSSLAFISILLVAAVLAVQELKPTKPRPRSDPEDDFGEDVESSIEYHTQLSSREIEREGLDFWHQISRQYEEYCDDRMSFVVEFLIVVAIILFAIFAYAVYSNSTSGRKKRSIASDDYDVDQLDIIDNVLLDGPTWLSMVHELWEQDSALENTACTQETLCRMNRLAMAAPGQAGWAVSLSSLPLSYLLHTRHTGGFGSYMDAALMGRSGANCTELYKSCPRLSY